MYIYVMSNPAFDGWLKVGKTKDLHTRLNAYNTHSPFEYDYVLVDEFHDDRPIHNRLLAQGIERSREWFKCDLDTVEQAIADVMAQHADASERTLSTGKNQAQVMDEVSIPADTCRKQAGDQGLNVH